MGGRNMTFAVARRFIANSQTGKYSLNVEVDTANAHLSFIGGNLPMQSESQLLEDQFDYVVMAQGLAAKQPRMVEFDSSSAQEVVDCLHKNLRYQTLMMLTLVFRVPLPLPFDICKPDPKTHIGLVVRASGKPGMSCGRFETWTVCASAALARQFALPKTKNDGLRMLSEAFFRTFNLDQFRKHLVTSHGTPFGLLWPHGQPIKRLPEGKRALFNPEAKVGVCADYCGGPPCVESAVVSALVLADAIAAHRDGRLLGDEVLTRLDVPWEHIPIPLPWTVAHFPLMPLPPSIGSSPMLEPSESCCPTHDWLGQHPGLVFGRTAALKPLDRAFARMEDSRATCKGEGDTNGTARKYVRNGRGRKAYSGC